MVKDVIRYLIDNYPSSLIDKRFMTSRITHCYQFAQVQKVAYDVLLLLRKVFQIWRNMPKSSSFLDTDTVCQVTKHFKILASFFIQVDCLLRNSIFISKRSRQSTLYFVNDATFLAILNSFSIRFALQPKLCQCCYGLQKFVFFVFR